MIRIAAISVALGVALTSCAAPPARHEVAGPAKPAGVAPSREPLSPERADVARRFLDLELVDQTGRRVRVFDDLIRDQVVVINFMYVTCNGACPGNTASLVRLQRELGPGVRFVSITLDAEHDTPEALAAYAAAHGCGPGWSFLTGDKDEIEALRKSLGFFDPDPEVDADRTQHAGIVLYGNERWSRWSHMPAQASASTLVAALRRVML